METPFLTKTETDTVSGSYTSSDSADNRYTYTDGDALHATSLYPLYFIPHTPVYVYATYPTFSYDSSDIYHTINSDLNSIDHIPDSPEEGFTDDSDVTHNIDSNLNETTDSTTETTDESDNLEGSESEEKPASITLRPWDWVQSPEFIPNSFTLPTTSNNLDQIDDDNDNGSICSSEDSVDTNEQQNGEIFMNSESIVNHNVPIFPAYYHQIPHYITPSYDDLKYGHMKHSNMYIDQSCWLYGNIPREYSLQPSDYIQCDQCMEFCLDPKDDDRNKLHRKFCSDRIEKEMEEAFALQRSEGKICSICYEEVIKKTTYTERRFGLLLGCLHVFCLSCIRKWRTNNGGDKNAVRGCPLCRTHSDYVIPSIYWVDEDESKAKLIHQYQIKLSRISCRYFNGGKGNCPFGNNCFYMHDVVDNSKSHNEKIKKYKNSEGTVSVITSLRLSDFIDHRDSRDIS